MVIKIVEWKVVYGQEKLSNEPVKLLFSGSQSDFAYVTKMLFGGVFSVVAFGRIPLSFFLFLARRNYYKCDLLLFQYKRTSSVTLRKTEYCLPLWVNATLSLPAQIKNNSLKNDIRLIKKNSLRYRVTDSTESIDDFYVNFWLPTIKKRYPETDTHKERESWNEYLCELLLVSDGECDIAGVLIRYDDDRPYVWRNGVKDGELSFWNKGAIAATYYFSAEYLCLRGYDSVNLGMSRAFLSDGVFRYKKKWGVAIKGRDRYAFGLGVFNDSVAVRKFLMNNPFFSFYNDGLYSTVFCEEVNDCEKEKYFYEGMDGVRVVDVNAMPLYKKE